MRLVALCLLVGCSYKPGLSSGDDQPNDSANNPTDGMPPDVSITDAPCSFSTQFDTCDVNTTMQMDPPSSVYNTDTHVLSDFPTNANPRTLGADEQRDLMGKAGLINVLLSTQFTLGGGRTFRVIGSKPLGILSTGNITIDGILDVSSVRDINDNKVDGAGSRTAEACGNATPVDPGDHVGGAGGGGGGAYQGAGGFGQDSDANETPEAGALGGLAVAIPSGPLGGCPGGKGGSNLGGNAQLSEGGRGGGAVYLVAVGTIDVKGAGRIHAGGAGGQGGDNVDGGGAGGGSGGFILLEAPTVKIDGVLAANGGGGGGGAGGSGKGANGGKRSCPIRRARPAVRHRIPAARVSPAPSVRTSPGRTTTALVPTQVAVVAVVVPA